MLLGRPLPLSHDNAQPRITESRKFPAKSFCLMQEAQGCMPSITTLLGPLRPIESFDKECRDQAGRKRQGIKACRYTVCAPWANLVSEHLQSRGHQCQAEYRGPTRYKHCRAKANSGDYGRPSKRITQQHNVTCRHRSKHGTRFDAHRMSVCNWCNTQQTDHAKTAHNEARCDVENRSSFLVQNVTVSFRQLPLRACFCPSI